MITSILSGGLGNQMFQFAAGYATASRLRTGLRLDVSNYQNNIRTYQLNIFSNIKANFLVGEYLFCKKNILNRFFLKYLTKNFNEKFAFKYDLNILNVSKNSFLNGYFQTEKYFKDYREDLLRIFEFPKIINAEILDIVEEMHSYNSVAIHVRRGDYVSNKVANKFHGVLSIQYYINAINRFRDLPNLKFYIFSDDLDYVNNSFDFLGNKKIVDLSEKLNISYLDMYLISQCKHQIIANSSFSWWGAWLNSYHEKIVIAPNSWIIDASIPVDDVIPVEWIKV